MISNSFWQRARQREHGLYTCNVLILAPVATLPNQKVEYVKTTSCAKKRPNEFGVFHRRNESVVLSASITTRCVFIFRRTRFFAVLLKSFLQHSKQVNPWVQDSISGRKCNNLPDFDEPLPVLVHNILFPEKEVEIKSWYFLILVTIDLSSLIQKIIRINHYTTKSEEVSTNKLFPR
jgi:hypothetical protein